MKKLTPLLIGFLLLSTITSTVVLKPQSSIKTSSSPTHSGPLSLNPSSCRYATANEFNTFTCDCSGGSGNYKWVYSELPTGWTVKLNVVRVPKRSIKNNYVYGLKVSVTDTVSQ
jgi:hypothetical protein